MTNHNLYSLNHVLIITWNFPPKKGGMENLNWNVYKHLSNHIDVSVIAPYSHEADSVPNIHRAPRSGFIFFLIYAFIQGTVLCYNKKPQIVFGGSLVVAPLLIFFKLFCPVAAYAHGLDIIYENRIYQVLLRFCLRFLDGIICNSCNTRNLIFQNNHRIKCTTVIPPCIEFARYEDNPPSPATLRNKYLLSVGRLTERKGLIEFIENCFVDIVGQYPHLDFVIAGGEPKEAVYHKVGYKKKLDEYITSKNLAGRIHLYGWVDEDTKIQLIRNCECLVFPIIPQKNDVEGFGIVAIEAAACGKPTVAFDVDGVSDAIIEGVTGELVAFNDYLNMKKAIQSIIEDGTRYPFSLAAVKERYDCNQVVLQYLDFFKRLQSREAFEN